MREGIRIPRKLRTNSTLETLDTSIDLKKGCQERKNGRKKRMIKREENMKGKDGEEQNERKEGWKEKWKSRRKGGRKEGRIKEKEGAEDKSYP